MPKVKDRCPPPGEYYEGLRAMEMIRKGRARRVAKGDTVAQIMFVEKLFSITA